MFERVHAIAEGQAYARHLGIRLEEVRENEAVLRLPYSPFLGDDRVNGGAIASLVDLAATSAFWARERLGPDARGATVGFTIHYLELVRGGDLLARARVRRRGGKLCVGEVSVTDEAGREVAMATVTYKLEA